MSPAPRDREPAPAGTFQRLIEDIYFERDFARGTQGTLLWFVEEVGELVRAIRRGERHNLEEEFGRREFNSTVRWCLTVLRENQSRA